jgi:hypothetical protein
MTYPATRWFRITEGEYAGRVHLRGWMLTALPDPQQPSHLVAVGICPVCSATVIADKEHSYGDRTWAHEQWHANTDYPIPAEFAQEAT